jgi:hypothetical protein
MSDWGTPVPDLDGIAEEARRLEAGGLDVHTITIVLNGQHGGFDVIIESTDTEMEDHKHEYILERYGSLTGVKEDAR